jgi:PAS domain S-box-containing protein
VSKSFNRVEYFGGTSQSVEQKQVEADLRKSKERLDLAVEVADIGEWNLDLISHTASRSLRHDQIFGYKTSLPNWTYEMFLDHVLPAHRAEVDEKFKASLASGGTWDFEAQIWRADGKLGWIWARGRLLRDETGRATNMFGTVMDITERKQAEERLRKSAALLAQAEQLAGLGSWEIDFKTNTLTWSDQIYRMLGLDREKTPLTPEFFWQVVVHPDDRERGKRLLEQAIATHQHLDNELRCVAADGSIRILHRLAVADYDEVGEPIRLIGTAQDITERKRAEGALKKSEERFSKVFRESPIALVLTSLKDHRFIEVNETFEHRTGWSRDEVIGRTSLDIGIWSDQGQRDNFLRLLLTEGHVRDFEVSVRLKNGEVRTGLGSAELVEINDEPCALTAVADITERKRAEAALREGEERFRLVANTAPVMIWMSGPDRLYTYFNQSWLKFTGRSIQAENGNGWREGVHRKDLSRCVEFYTKAFDRRESFEMEYRLRRHDGEYRWILDHGVPRFDVAGSFAGYIGSCIDISERRLAEEALATMSRKLIEAQEEERRWIARELHDDFSQRIAWLAVSLGGLKQAVPASAAEVRRAIKEASKQVSDLGLDIQALSHRLHSSKLENLGLAAAAAGFCKELSEQQKVEIDFHSERVPKDLPQEVAICLFRVLQEALQNGTKYSGSRRFQASLNGKLDEIQLMVSDQGIGFDPEEAIKGRGIGLISMKERLALVNGDLSIDSQRQHGTVIRARVPLIRRSKYGRAAG